MKLYTLELDGIRKIAVGTAEGKAVTLDKLGVEAADMNELIMKWDDCEEKIKEGLSSCSDENTVNLDDVKVLAPIPEPRQDVVCLGVNYREHFEETQDGINFVKQADTVYFSKRVNRSNDPGGVIPNYDFVDSLDYETELGVVLKKDALGVSEADAPNYILGYTIINDVSARNVQKRHQQWYLGKSLDGYTPMGPCIVTADELGDPHDLRISCYVNGEKRQNSSTKLMITTVEKAISELSQGMMLKAGTVIATGTPGGVGMGMKPPVFLKSGDVVRCEIEGIGVLENVVE